MKTAISVLPSGKPLGAEVCGVDLRTMSHRDFAAILRAWNDHSVLLVRGQQLTDDDLIAFSRRFGDLDWAPAGSYVKEFSDAMVALEKGKMTETPVKSQFGYHIIRLDDVREPQLPKFDEVKPQITQQLAQQKLAKFQDELRGKAKVE